MTVCVFLGPTLPVDDACAVLDAVYLPPVRRGDVLSAMEEHGPRAVAIIDGYFEQAPSVWHKELLWALSQGVAVYGAASMGALRAAELAQFGMIGVGRIYEAYANGRFDPFEEPFEDDDEVAVAHGPAELGYVATDALVDVRATLAAASEAGLIDAAQMRTIASVGKGLFYKWRTWSAILAAAGVIGVETEALERLQAGLPEIAVPQKRIDALELLRRIADGIAAPEPAAFRFERTTLWERVVAEIPVTEVEWPSR